MVKIYTRASCSPCQTLKYWLKQKGVAYEELDLDTAPELEAEVKNKLGYFMAPVSVIDDEVVAGLNLPRLSQLLRL